MRRPRRHPFDPPLWIVLVFAIAMFLLIVNACYVYADHDTLWPIISEKQLTDWSKRGLRYRLVEWCVSQAVGLCAEILTPLPRLAISEPWPCMHDWSEVCLAGGVFSGWYDGIHNVIVLPKGRDDAFEHECVHSIAKALTGDGDYDHNSAPWTCEEARVKP